MPPDSAAPADVRNRALADALGVVVVGVDHRLAPEHPAMAARLSAAGNDVDLRIYPESPHGFTGHATAMARTALDAIGSRLGDRISSP